MAKRLRSGEEQSVERERNSLWWLNNLQEMFFLILRHLPIEDIVECRLVCHAWSGWALHDLVWSLHVARFKSLYPFFEQEFLNTTPKQTIAPGRQIERVAAAKRRKPGGKKKVAPRITETLSKSGDWFAIKKFLNNKLAMARAQTIHALGEHFVGLEKGVETKWYVNKQGWKFIVGLENVDGCFLFSEMELVRAYFSQHRYLRSRYHYVQNFRIALSIDGIFHCVKLSSNLRKYLIGRARRLVSNVQFLTSPRSNNSSVLKLFHSEIINRV